MGWTNFIKKFTTTRYGDYTQSQHAAVYEQIARRLGTNPQHVYEIAHGKGFRCHDDRVIWESLLAENIVYRFEY